MSEKRAETIARRLIPKKYYEDRVRTVGLGSSEPIEENDQKIGDRLKRERIVITIIR